jgi:chaperonin GroES
VAGTVICVGPGKKEKDEKGKEKGDAKAVSVQPGAKVLYFKYAGRGLHSFTFQLNLSHF